MAATTGTSAGTSDMSEGENLALPDDAQTIGDIAPLIGRTIYRDVTGYFGFSIARAGETVTRAIAERAQSQARLFELTAATEDI